MASPEQQDRPSEQRSGQQPGQQQRGALDEQLDELSEGQKATGSDRWKPLGKEDKAGERESGGSDSGETPGPVGA